VVRPYAITAGRTLAAAGDLDLICLVLADRPVAPADARLGPEHQAILRLCRQLLSVAEVAAHLDLPVGVVRVLLGDLRDRGLVHVRAPVPASRMPTERIFRAVINGLRAL
jgi:hypothetical protein